MNEVLDSILFDYGVDLADESTTYSLTRNEIISIVRGTVHATLIEIGFKPHSFQSGKIYKKEMEKVIGVRGYQKAVKSGRLPVKQDGERTSPVYALRSDWERYIKLHVNQKA